MTFCKMGWMGEGLRRKPHMTLLRDKIDLRVAFNC